MEKKLICDRKVKNCSYDISYGTQPEVNNGITRVKDNFSHKSFEERLEKYNGKVTVCDFDWGSPMGREVL